MAARCSAQSKGGQLAAAQLAAARSLKRQVSNHSNKTLHASKRIKLTASRQPKIFPEKSSDNLPSLD
jgi:hypothetical protein